MGRDTVIGAIGDALRRQQLRLLAAMISTKLRKTLMSFGLLDGFKTYIVAAAMVLAGIAQLVGVDLPSFDGQASGQLLMEGLALLFLRHGVKQGS
jgi:hypothetical protein